MFTHHPKVWLQTSTSMFIEWSTNIPGMVITFPRLVTHHFQDGQLDMEFDSSEAQIVLLLLLLIPKQTFKAWSKSGEFNCFIVVVDSRSKSRVSNSWHNNGDIEFPVCRGGICRVVVLSIGCGWVRGLTIILRGCPPPPLWLIRSMLSVNCKLMKMIYYNTLINT